MSRRTLTLLLAGVLAVVLTGAAVATPVPYVALQPGPVYNTTGEVGGKPVIAIRGAKTYPTDGELDLTTVGVQARLTLVEAVQGWFDRSKAVVPRDVIYPRNKTRAQVDQENAASMTRSQNSAVTAAARELGYVKVTVQVAKVSAGSPSDGRLRAGDVLTTVDGAPVTNEAALRAAITGAGVGRALTVGYRRGGTPATTRITTAGAPDDASRPVIGIEPAEVPVDPPFDVAISLQEVGGPSAGLMFTLGILDKLGQASLTGGRRIAGTGEIAADGTVGPIGGIQQKLLAARARGAVAFLVPANNCAEALQTAPAGLTLVKVDTLDTALAGLEALRAGRTPTTCAS